MVEIPVTPGPGYGLDDPRSRTLVTLDGPAGVGKSTTARAVARELGYRYLDSGALYRAVTYGLLRSGLPESAWDGVTASDLADLGVSVTPGPATLEIRYHGGLLEDELRTERITELVPRVARIPAVRAWLLTAQRAAAEEGRLVADGRDMGTVVFPQAWVKVFLQADVRERARRRLGDHGVVDPDPDQIHAEVARLQSRDRQDQDREVAPLRKPPNALVVDTTHLTFHQQVDRIAAHARAVAEGSAPPAVDAQNQ
ncbi:MAG: (d)CMP kinase [Gemmatimonadales bacterium]|jgi:cytidylate kinase|nr:MAG: (d)CMP kinase [Gemmatimonadales bacterium]